MILSECARSDYYPIRFDHRGRETKNITQLIGLQENHISSTDNQALHQANLT